MTKEQRVYEHLGWNSDYVKKYENAEEKREELLKYEKEHEKEIIRCSYLDGGVLAIAFITFIAIFGIDTINCIFTREIKSIFGAPYKIVDALVGVVIIVIMCIIKFAIANTVEKAKLIKIIHDYDEALYEVERMAVPDSDYRLMKGMLVRDYSYEVTGTTKSRHKYEYWIVGHTDDFAILRSRNDEFTMITVPLKEFTDTVNRAKFIKVTQVYKFEEVPEGQ